MQLELSDEALEYGRLSQRAFESAGGDQLVQTAEAEPDRRERLVAPVLEELGAWQLDPRASADELEAAAALCRSAGYWALPYPVAERLSRPRDNEVDGLLVVAGPRPAGRVAGLDLSWEAVDLEGRKSSAAAIVTQPVARESPLVCEVELRPAGESAPSDVALGLTLPCWTLLGMLDRAMALTRAHILAREQFGQPLASFQGVQFQLTDAEVERVGLEELAKYTLWSLETGREDACADALALRLAALEAADTVFRVAHQLHGAIGFCDETTLSWISRHSTPLRRLPTGLSATRQALAGTLGRRGLAGLYG
jgi:hypothetical protein